MDSPTKLTERNRNAYIVDLNEVTIFVDRLWLEVACVKKILIFILICLYFALLGDLVTN